MKFQLLIAGMAMAAATSASAATLTIVSDGSTLAAATDEASPTLVSGDITGLTFGPATVGALGTFTSVPPGAPAGAEVINISADGGASGFFLVDFTLPTGATNVSINGAFNVDDDGFVFVNGNSLAEGDEFSNTTFTSSDQTIFKPGENQFLVSDINSGGGPSGAAFFATVSYAAVPEPASWAMMLVGFGGLGAAMRAGRKAKSAVHA